MPEDRNSDRIASIGHSFLQNLSAVRVFNERVGGVAVEHDRSAIRGFVDKLKALMPEGFSERASKSEPSNQEEIEQASGDQPQEPADDEAIARAVVDDATKVAELMAASRQFMREAPVQADLLRTSVVISLASYLEALIADLIHEYYARFPDALPSDDRTLSLSELREIGSVEEAERYLVAKEVDTVLRESLEAQLAYFSKRPKIDLGALDPYRSELLEIGQRRNLYVHNRGIVNRVYRRNVSADLVEKFSARDGVQLHISEEYLIHAIDTVEICGMILLQQCWRKWEKRNTAPADNFMMNTTFENLLEGQYRVVEQLAKYSIAVPFASDAEKRIVCVNHAISLRDSGRADEIEAVLSRYDWSACSLDFQVALAAVRMDEEALYRLLPRAAAAGELTREQMLTWPLFAPYRTHERFATEIDRLFPPQRTELNRGTLNALPAVPGQNQEGQSLSSA